MLRNSYFRIATYDVDSSRVKMEGSHAEVVEMTEAVIPVDTPASLLKTMKNLKELRCQDILGRYGAENEWGSDIGDKLAGPQRRLLRCRIS
jgi:hypothetical protein